VAAMLPNVVLHVVDILGLDRIGQNVDNLDLAWVPFAVDSFLYSVCLIFCLMVFNATFNNISVISWQSVLLVEETGGHRENHRLVASH
jgi:hypothetical protein